MGASAQRADRIPLHSLTFIAEGDEVVVGRSDNDSHAVFPVDGASLVQRLVEGMPLVEAAHWYEVTYGDPVDIEDFLKTLRDLDFLAGDTDAVPALAPPRWRRLGRAAFSIPAWICYAAMVTSAVTAVLRDHSLLPTPQSMLFSDYLTVVTVVLFSAQIPLVLLHECLHMLAGRRLDLPSRLTIGRRLYFIVAETVLTGLWRVPRQKRYLVLLAGMLGDVVAIAALVDLAALLTHSPVARVLLGIAYVTVLRLTWQLYFYLETDLYYVLSTALGTVDLQTNARRELRRWTARAMGRPGGPVDPPSRERFYSRLYAPLLAIGYLFSLTALVVSLPPVVHRIAAGLRAGPARSVDRFLDSSVFLGLILLQVAVLVTLAVRERRSRARFPEGASA